MEHRYDLNKLLVFKGFQVSARRGRTINTRIGVDVYVLADISSPQIAAYRKLYTTDNFPSYLEKTSNHLLDNGYSNENILDNSASSVIHPRVC